MRLIDADWLQERLAKEPMENRTYLRANEIIADAPTAYDVDKAVERLEEKARGSWGYPSVMEFDDVIEIVKSGVIE